MTKLFTSLLVVAMVGAMATPMVQAQLGGKITGLTRIQGIVFCTVDGNIGVNGTATPPFPNAMVQLRCGSQPIMSTAITNGTGGFSILLGPVPLPSTLVSNCNVVVTTPLVNCNATLPSTGTLVSPLRIATVTYTSIFRVVDIIPVAFRYVADTLLP